MRYSDYQRAFSFARINRYLVACGGNRKKAIILYRYNIKLCQNFYAILGVFEVTLRNTIDNHYRIQFTAVNWLETQSEHNGVFNNSIFQRGNFESRRLIRSGIKKLNLKYTHDRLVSSMSFGFWIMMFNKLQFSVCGKTLHHIFLNRPAGALPREMYKELDRIRDFRNRVAHYEPVCFDVFHQKNTAYAREHYDLICKYAEWLGFNPEELFYGIDRTLQMINKIAALK